MNLNLFWSFMITLNAMTNAFQQGLHVIKRKVILQGEKGDDKDPIEKLFGFFFGEVEERPMGLSRMSVETAPDQYPAELLRKAEPIDTDDPICAQYIRPTLAQTFLEKRELRLAYDANVDGWSPEAFHRAVDKQGPGILLCSSIDGQRFGGYNPKGWVGYGEYRSGLSAFLFYWKSKEAMTKLRKVGGAGLAVVDNPEQGPFFGSEGLCVPMLEGSERRVRIKLGPYYQRCANGAKSFLRNAEPDTVLDNLQVWLAVYAEGEDIPFDDAIPFSLT